MSTYYDILRVPEGADDKEIKAAYRQAALAYHPDHIPKGVSKRMREDAGQTWLEVQEAFAVLSDPAKREEYDTLLREMRQSEEDEQQFEPPASPPEPPKPKASPSPTPQQTGPQSVPQPRPNVPTKTRRAWLWACFQAGRHWRKLCWLVTGILYFVNGERNPETWTATPTSCAVFGGIAVIVILVASDVAWKDKGRYIANSATVISLVITGIFTASISSPPPESKTVPIGKAGATLTLDALSNMTHRFGDLGTLTLVNGEWQNEQEHGWLDKDHFAFGDLDGDGVDDAVVVLFYSGGGSGIFYSLVAVMQHNGRLEPTAVKSLGDRIRINAILIRDGIVTVDMITQGPNDGLCCPTERQVIKLAVRGNRFISVQ